MDGKAVTVKYLLDGEGRKDSLRRGGDGQSEQAAHFPLTDEWLELAHVDELGTAEVFFHPPHPPVYTWTIATTEYVGAEDDRDIPGIVPVPVDVIHEDCSKSDIPELFDHVPSEDELMQFVRMRRAAVATRRALTAAKEAVVAAQRDEWSARSRWRRVNAAALNAHFERKALLEKQREEEAAARVAAQRDARRAAQDRAIAWIEAHGSPRLKLAAKHQFQFTQIYLDERLARELPGFVADHEGKILETACANPSLAALLELEDVLSRLSPESDFCSADIVRAFLGTADDEDSPEGCEAVRVRFQGSDGCVDCYKRISPVEHETGE